MPRNEGHRVYRSEFPRKVRWPTLILHNDAISAPWTNIFLPHYFLYCHTRKMKRSADGTVIRRQTPTSCVLCRTKKLKCDRAQPCSNCKARNIACSFLETPQSSSERVSASRTSPLSLQALDARLRRIEELLGAPTAPVSDCPNGPPKDPSYENDRSMYMGSYFEIRYFSTVFLVHLFTSYTDKIL